jgi:hypothetical protein
MNNYEAPNAMEMGQAHDLILGPKPDDITIDFDGDLNKRDVMSDLDETD